MTVPRLRERLEAREGQPRAADVLAAVAHLRAGGAVDLLPGRVRELALSVIETVAEMRRTLNTTTKGKSWRTRPQAGPSTP